MAHVCGTAEAVPFRRARDATGKLGQSTKPFYFTVLLKGSQNKNPRG